MITLRNSVTPNQVDIWLDDAIVGHIFAKELKRVFLPEPGYANSGKNKLIIQHLDGSKVPGFDGIDDETADDETADNETDEISDESTAETSKETEETSESNDIITDTELMQVIEENFVNIATEGLSEVKEIIKEFPNIAGLAYAKKMKLWQTQKLYNVLKAIRDYRYEKPALAVMKTGTCIIETSKVFVVIDFNKKTYCIKILDANSNSGTLVHNAMLTNFGEFRQVSNIGIEALLKVSTKALNALKSKVALESVAVGEPMVDCNGDDIIRQENIGTTVAMPANTNFIRRSTSDKDYLNERDSILVDMESVHDKDHKRIASMMQHLIQPDKILHVFYKCMRDTDLPTNTRWRYWLVVENCIVSAIELRDFGTYIGALAIKVLSCSEGNYLHIVIDLPYKFTEENISYYNRKKFKGDFSVTEPESVDMYNYGELEYLVPNVRSHSEPFGNDSIRKALKTMVMIYTPFQPVRTK